MKDNRKKILKNKQTNNDIPEDKLLVSYNGDKDSPVMTVYKDWDVSGQKIKKIKRPDGEKSQSIALKGDLKSFMSKDSIIESQDYLPLTGGYMNGDINMGSHSITGLPTSASEANLSEEDMASVGIVKEDIDALSVTIQSLIDRVNKILENDVIKKILKDLGSPESNGNGVDITKPNESKWVVRNGQSPMKGAITFGNQGEGEEKKPTIVGLPKHKSLSNISNLLRTNGITDDTDIISVQDVLDVIDYIQKNKEDFENGGSLFYSTLRNNTPESRSFKVMSLSCGQPSVTAPKEDYRISEGTEKYIEVIDNFNVKLLRRGNYNVTFFFSFEPGTSEEFEESSCVISLTYENGEKIDYQKTVSKKGFSLSNSLCVCLDYEPKSNTDVILGFNVQGGVVGSLSWSVSYEGSSCLL